MPIIHVSYVLMPENLLRFYFFTLFGKSAFITILLHFECIYEDIPMQVHLQIEFIKTFLLRLQWRKILQLKVGSFGCFIVMHLFIYHNLLHLSLFTWIYWIKWVWLRLGLIFSLCAEKHCLNLMCKCETVVGVVN